MEENNLCWKETTNSVVLWLWIQRCWVIWCVSLSRVKIWQVAFTHSDHMLVCFYKGKKKKPSNLKKVNVIWIVWKKYLSVFSIFLNKIWNKSQYMGYPVSRQPVSYELAHLHMFYIEIHTLSLLSTLCLVQKQLLLL